MQGSTGYMPESIELQIWTAIFFRREILRRRTLEQNIR